MILNLILWILGIFTSLVLFLLTKQFSFPNVLYFGLLYLFLIPIFYALWFSIDIIILFIYSLFINKKKDVKVPSKFHYVILKQTIHVLHIFARIKVHTTGLEKLPKNTRYLLVTNHTSNFDPMIYIDKIQERLLCITKLENEKIPIAGSFIHKCGFIKLDRKNPKNAMQSINLAVDYLEKNYGNIFICPEGTRSKNGIVLPFHAGSFKVAFKANVPIVICSIKNANKIHKNFPLKRTHVYVDVLKIISPNQFDDTNTTQIASEAERIIKENLTKYEERN